MYTRGVDFDRREVFFVGKNGENFKSTVVEGWGFEAQWSESGDKILYSVYSPKDELKPKLWIVNASAENIGANRTNLQLETWAEKCSFASNNEVYCAVPRELPEGAGLNPDLALKTFDDLYKINISTGQKELIATPDSAFNISSISVSKDQKTLFFTDYLNKQIHKINLQ
jgi:Tol biopolymer transport system component